MKTEQQIQKRISDKLEQDGYFVIKLIKTNKNGIPDLIAVKENKVMFIEVKKPKGVLSPVQKYMIKLLINMKLDVRVWTDYNADF